MRIFPQKYTSKVPKIHRKNDVMVVMYPFNEENTVKRLLDREYEIVFFYFMAEINFQGNR